MNTLQFITHQTDQYSYIDSALLALQGGCRWIQLRMKDASEAEIEATALQLKPICKQYNATFIIDDHVQVAINIGAHGVHLGKNDMPVSEARNLMGNKYIIGGTANTFEDLKQLVIDGVDYVGLGPFRFTQTKKNLSPILGLDGYTSVLKSCNVHRIHIPIVAIGGITINDIQDLTAIGIKQIALSSTILQAADPVAETQLILETLNK